MRRRELLLRTCLRSLRPSLPPGLTRGRCVSARRGAAPFDGATVRNLARDLAQARLPGAGLLAAGRAEQSRIPGLSRHPLRPGPRAVARTGAQVHRRVLSSRLPVQAARRHLRSGEWPRRADPLQPGPVHVRQGEAAGRGHRLRGLSHPQPDQPARTTSTRSARSSARATSARWRRVRGTACRRAGWRSRPRNPPARSSRSSARSGSSGRRRAATRSSCMRCSTARVRRRHSASPSVRASQTVFDTEMALYPRTDIAACGFAPLTSMFLFDANDRTRVDDYREAVHDSDGLRCGTARASSSGGRWPIRATLQISAFSDTGPRGFGLMQRERDFADYQDLEAHYEKRPCALGRADRRLGRGASSSWWRSRPTARSTTTSSPSGGRSDPLKANGEYILTYRLHWCWSSPPASPLAEVAERAAVWRGTRRTAQFVIDFVGGDLKGRRAGALPAIDVGARQGQDRERRSSKPTRRPAAGGSASSSPGQREAGRAARAADGRRNAI